MNGTTAMKQAVGPFSPPRLLLLVLLALGVAGMHTLGHVGDGHHPAPAVVDHADSGMVTQPHAGADQPVAASDADDARDHGLRLDVFAVCLAVLGAVGILLWAARTGRLRSGYVRLLRARWAPQPAGRGPPPVPVGLRLAVVSVSRT
jgi:hypothetical protein